MNNGKAERAFTIEIFHLSEILAYMYIYIFLLTMIGLGSIKTMRPDEFVTGYNYVSPDQLRNFIVRPSYNE